MSGMVERVARALYVQAWEEPTNWLEEEDEMAAIFRPNARAAIAAMREPTEAMFDRGIEAYASPPPHIAAQYAVWTAMIDAALQEDTP